MTGQIGRPGTGPCSITGQCNAMGSRLFSNTTNLIGGHSFEKPAHREKVARILGVDEPRLPTGPGLPYDGILDAIRDGKIRALWVIGTNPAHSWINRGELASIMDKLDFLVVQDMYKTTETAQLADLVLPAAGWGEKEGTFINSERRIGRTRKLRESPGEARSDFEIVRAVAEAFECQDLVERWKTPEDVFHSMKELSRGRPCDVTGIEGYAMLDRVGGIQWPLPEGTIPEESERRLFADGLFFHADRRARFCYEEPHAPPEPPDSAYPFVLLTGRGSSSQWHTDTRTGKSAVLRSLAPDAGYVEIHPEDAARLAIREGSEVQVRSRRGRVRLRARVQATLRPGQLFVPMHDAESNNLTYPCVDPYSRQPSYKHCAVTIRGMED
jgi:assimilatory nitrate reductase catalytic subunit